MKRFCSIVLLMVFCFCGSQASSLEIYSYSDKVRKMDEAADLGSEKGAEILIDFLRDSDLRVRTTAISKLVEMGEPAVPVLVSYLGDEDVRWLISGALINIGKPALRPLVLSLKSANPAIRRNAIFVLRQLNAVEAAPSIQLCLDDPDISVQVQAIYTICKLGGEGALRLIINKMKDDRIQIRSAAIQGMSYFGDQAIPYLVNILAGASSEAKISAIKSLGLIGSHRGITYILKALGDRDEGVRYQACVTIVEFGDSSVLTELVGMFNDPSIDVREAANESVSKLAKGSEALLMRLLRKGTTLEKINTAIVVRKISSSEFSPLMIDLLKDPSSEVRIAAVTALLELEEPESVEPLVNSLLDKDVRWFSVLALRRFGHKNIKPILRRSNDPELDYWKQYVLEGMGEKALEGCIECLKEEDLGIRISSICTLKQIKNTRAVYPLIKLLGDDKLGTLVSYVISQMGEVAVEPLIVSLHDDNPRVRARAALALGEVGLTRVVNPLKNLLGDDDPYVRGAAQKAIDKIRKTAGETGDQVIIEGRGFEVE